MNATVFFVVLRMLLMLGVPLLIAALVLRRMGSWFGLSHPWWTHLPGAGVFVGALAFAGLVRAIGGSDVPVAYIDSVNQYPTFGRFLSYFCPIGILVIGASVLLDELWVRQETRKTYNWMSLLDEAVIGFMLMLSYGKEYHFDSAHVSVTLNSVLATCVAVMVGVAALLELFRRPSSREQHAIPEDTTMLEAELSRRTRSGERISYFEGQNPAYLTVLVVVVCTALVFGAVMVWMADMPWVSLLLLVIAGVTALAYGGIRVSVTSALLDVRLGMLGIHLLTLPTADVSQVSVCLAGVAADPGNGGDKRDIRSLSFGGHRGVIVSTALGQRYLVGSDRPERLAAVLRAVAPRG